MNTEHELVFALSYPVQVSVAGMTTAFMVLLALHQCFTAAYHFPLDPLNFVLQLVSSIVYVVYHGATLGVQLRELDEFSHRWPHMFPYMAYRLPRYGHWTTVQMVFFILAEALASLLAHAAHIQFLMLLFPSKLERRLIFWLLGPFVLIETGLFFVDLVPPDHVKVLDLSDAMMNICDSSLALLYMSGLLVWGGLVNWRRAWRADGSTAAFGVAALLVALCKTVVSFVHIGYDRVYWLRLMTATFTNWQNWLGFWWWVSAGMGIGEYEDRLRATEKRRRTKQRRASLAADGGGEDVEMRSMHSATQPPEHASHSNSAPWTVRLLERLVSRAPRLIRRRFER
ncbi:hypothetical protein DNF11_4042 [Malassezia restricta CBS 7877]|uniref:Uncharacterized protein n=1 Tax=Malassezia restricta (strain ATCC 96810 / NBRC 103918 / CBS 7877) TaxID=425264 RepID=A0A3G2SBS3_MALR7|nr:hypothetical protein DNF11_4042 [Malassezia restricta CBS 7877]